jgi:8-oxo-dGTP pyrophosphatase MutT (NUDIX family)
MVSPAPARPAATVVLARDGGGGVETLLLRRSARSRFASGAWVFPGGVLDPGDAALPGRLWRGISPEAAADRFAASPQQVLALHVAAVRETFEESGLLLARDRHGEPVDPAAAAALRPRAGSGSLEAFASVLDRSGFIADLGALVYLSRWITPLVEPRRYDARFFLARAPCDQVAGADAVETTDQRWVRPAAALCLQRAGDLRLMFPTLRTLRWLSAWPDVDSALAAAAAQPLVPAILPEAIVDGAGRVVALRHPDEAECEPAPT